MFEVVLGIASVFLLLMALLLKSRLIAACALVPAVLAWWFATRGRRSSQ